MSSGKWNILKDLENFSLVTKTNVGFSFWISLTTVTLTFTPNHSFIILHQTLKLSPPQSWAQNFDFLFSSSLGSLLQSYHLLLSTPITLSINYGDGLEMSACPSFPSPDGYFQLAVLTWRVKPIFTHKISWFAASLVLWKAPALLCHPHSQSPGGKKRKLI